MTSNLFPRAPWLGFTGIPKGAKRGWTVTVNGQQIEADSVVIDNGRYGTLAYGHNGVYDGWGFHEIEGKDGRGSPVLLPYAFVEPKVPIIGGIYEGRPLMGRNLELCAIGGFASPGASVHQQLAEEAREESGLTSAKAFELDEGRINPNRAFFVGKSVKPYGLEIPITDLAWREDGHCWELSPGAQAVMGGRHLKAAATRFYPWHELAERTSDGILLSAAYKLLANLKRQNKL